MASAIFFESRSTILATIEHNWQCISWLIIDSTKEFHVDRYECSRIGSKIERAVMPFHAIFKCPGHSSDMSHATIGPCTGQSAGSVRANRTV